MRSLRKEIEHAIASLQQTAYRLPEVLFVFSQRRAATVPAGMLQKAAKLVRDAGGVVILTRCRLAFVELAPGGLPGYGLCTGY